MPEVEHDTGFLSIGEVLDLLVEEFPDVTISKIRFLESQGLISPQRTASGYRKFYEEDVDLLRVILTEQRQNFLPLKVIRDRLETGEIDPTGEQLRLPSADLPDETPFAGVADTRAADPWSSPSGETSPSHGAPRPAFTDRSEPGDTNGPRVASSELLAGIRVDRAEFCSVTALTDDELDELESFGVITPVERNGVNTYDAADAAVAQPAGEFLRLGVDARHLRTFHTAAEREASLFGQLVEPRLRQRNPHAKQEALNRLTKLDHLGAELRSAFMAQLLAARFNR